MHNKYLIRDSIIKSYLFFVILSKALQSHNLKRKLEKSSNESIAYERNISKKEIALEKRIKTAEQEMHRSKDILFREISVG